MVIPYLKECRTFAYVRFVHDNCGGVDGGLSTSCGSLGRFLYKDLSSKYKEDRRRLLAKRSLALLKAEEEKDEESTSDNESASDDSDDSDSDESASGIEPDSEDEALLQENESDSDSQGDAGDALTSGGALASVGDGKDNKTQAEKELSELIDAQVSKQESTRHLDYGLLGLDVGYSSDEGGDEDVAYYVSDIAWYIMACLLFFLKPSTATHFTLPFSHLLQIDGVDGAFTRANEVPLKPVSKVPSKDTAADEVDALRVKKTDFSIIGKTAQLQVAVALTSNKPDHLDFGKKLFWHHNPRSYTDDFLSPNTLVFPSLTDRQLPSSIGETDCSREEKGGRRCQEGRGGS